MKLSHVIGMYSAVGALLTGLIGIDARGVEEYPLAPCEHVIMMSAPSPEDGGILAYCAGSEFFVYDEQDEQWCHMTLVHLRGVGIVPVRDDRVAAVVRHMDLIGDHRAVGMYN